MSYPQSYPQAKPAIMDRIASLDATGRSDSVARRDYRGQDNPPSGGWGRSFSDAFGQEDF